jgi:hemerythrin
MPIKSDTRLQGKAVTQKNKSVKGDDTLSVRAEFRQTLYTLRRTQAVYGRFVPKDFIKLLGDGDILNVHLGNEVEKKITVMFTDIRDFTTLSESMSSRQTFEFLNEYLSHMEPPVQRHGGIVDKFIGDAIMALFPKCAEDAILAALSMREALHYFNTEREKHGLAAVRMGIGLNTGLLTLGVLGHLERMESTVIGDAVNVSQRIESLTKVYKVGILISEDTISTLSDPNEFSIRFVDRVKVKGRHRPISVYEVFDGDETETARTKLTNLDLFEKGVAYYHLREIDLAAPLFETVTASSPNDTVAAIYLERCRNFTKNGIYEGVGELIECIGWNEAFNTGLDDVDEQHRTLLEHINKLSRSIQDDDNTALVDLFDFLGNYGIEHFATEERYMKEYGYPFLTEHEVEHAAFIRGFMSTKQEILSGRHDKLISLFRINLFLYDWLISHSTRFDKHFADFVLQKRVKQSK